MTIAMASKRREFTALVLRVLMEVDIAQIHLLKSRCRREEPLVRTFFNAKISGRLRAKTFSFSVFFQSRVLYGNGRRITMMPRITSMNRTGHNKRQYRESKHFYHVRNLLIDEKHQSRLIDRGFPNYPKSITPGVTTTFPHVDSIQVPETLSVVQRCDRGVVDGLSRCSPDTSPKPPDRQTTTQSVPRHSTPYAPWHEADCTLLTLPAVATVMLPKAELVHEVQALAQRLREDQHLLPLIETVEGVANAQSIAQVARVQRLAFGTVDFMSDSGLQGEASLDPVRVMLALASRRARRLAPVDGVSLAINDDAQVQSDARHAREWGFAAKLCIHPRQIQPVHRAFAPTEAALVWAQRVVDAMAGGVLGAVAVDGKLVDKPVLLRAQDILAQR